MRKSLSAMIAVILCLGICACAKTGDYGEAGENIRNEAARIMEDMNVRERIDDFRKTVEGIADEVKTQTKDVSGKILDEYVSHFPDTKSFQKTSEAEIPADGIHEIEINWLNGTVRIETYDGNTIRFSEQCESSLEGEQQMRYGIEADGELKIVCCERGRKSATLPEKELTVFVPAGLFLEELELKCVSADAEIRELNAGKIKAESVSGALKATGTASDELDFESVSGNAVLDGINVRKELEIETVSSAVEVKLSDQVSGFTLSMEGIGADFTSELPCVTSHNSRIYGDGSLKIDFESIGGSLHIS